MAAAIVFLLWRTIIMAESLGKSRESATDSKGLEVEEMSESQEV
jgi:hypothetical protein